MRSPIFIFIFCLLFTPVHGNQVVLITGASRGIGYATAELLAHDGYTVYAGMRNPSLVTQQRDLKNFHVIQLDVTNQQSIDLAINKIVDNEGHLDVLINNAGIMIYGSVENLTIEEAKNVFDVNFFGVMRVTQAVLPVMRGQKRGRIIQISSRSGFRPLPSISIYAASKYALEGLSETMAATLKPWNIDISLVQPGPVSSELDFISPYGSRLLQNIDPYYSIFHQAGLLDPNSPIAQSPQEIALLIKQIIEAEKPLFRYQTTENIKKQAALRLVDITGNSAVTEWHHMLFAEVND
jgi:NAD(P)-dependent dehydrogenase (short-subunit alcohol dehydrogenase family)